MKLKRPALRRCTITSALPLGDEQRTTLERLLHRRFPEPLDYTYRIDQRCLGGLRIQTRDWFFDTTLEGRLTRSVDLFLSQYAHEETPQNHSS